MPANGRWDLIRRLKFKGEYIVLPEGRLSELHHPQSHGATPSKRY